MPPTKPHHPPSDAAEPEPGSPPGDEPDDDHDDTAFNALMVKQREANDQIVQNRKQALRARDEGFPIPVRRMGDIECSSLKAKLPECVPVEGDFPTPDMPTDKPGRSALQDLVISNWHPVRTVVRDGGVAEEVVNKDDPKLQQIERAYPGLGVAEFIVKRWQELQRVNSSGGYTVEIPWHAKLERELTPAEVTTILMRGKGKGRKKKKKG